MKALTISILFLLAVSFVNPHSLGRFFIDEPLERGETETAYFNIRNNLRVNLEDVNVKLYIYNLGLVYTSIPNDISKKDNTVQRVFIDIPDSIAPGLYLTKITVGNDKVRDTQHVYLRII